MKYLLLLLLVSCASNEPKHYRVTTTTMNCPKDYLYNQRDGLCHYMTPPKPVFKKKVKVAKINCVKAINYCGFNK